MRFLNRAAGSISRHRRGGLAGVAVLVVGLLLTGGFYTAFSPSSSAADGQDQSSLAAEGRELFLVNCSYCHGTNAEGITSEDGIVGPSLVGVGAASVDFQVGTGRMPMVQPGPQVKVKKNVFTDHEVEALAAFVASLAPGPAIPGEEQYSTAGLSEEEREAAVVRGGQIFLTNCTACHNFTGASGAMPRGGVAPSLFDTTPKHIYEAMLTGPQSMDTFSDGNIPPEMKRDVIAYIESMREQPGYGGFGLGSLGPVSEGLFAWIVGIGALVGFAVWIAAHTTRTTKTKKGENA